MYILQRRVAPGTFAVPTSERPSGPGSSRGPQMQQSPAVCSRGFVSIRSLWSGYFFFFFHSLNMPYVMPIMGMARKNHHVIAP